MGNVEGYEGPLAEFVALRGELLQYSQHQNQLFALQLTLAGAVFSFAISQPRLIGVALVVPVASYLLCLRYLTRSRLIHEMARYIQEDLSARVPGGLRWEDWLAKRRKQTVRSGVVMPLLLTYPGVAILALSWTALYPLRQPIAAGVGLSVVWLLGACGAVHQIVLIARQYGGGILGFASRRRIRPE
jgi:hypothetical protein